MRFLLRWILNAAALLVITHFIQGISVSGWAAALMAALFLGLVNAIIRPIVILLTLPLNIATFGLFILIINAFLFWMVARILDGFAVATFAAAFWGALCMSIISLCTSSLFKNDK